MGFLGLFKSQEERDLEDALTLIAEALSRTREIVARLEREYSSAQRRVAAESAVRTIMQASRNRESLDKMRATIGKLGIEPDGEGPLHFGMTLAFHLVYAGCVLGQLKGMNWLNASFGLAQVEGVVKGFVERTGAQSWTASYIEDMGEFERERQRFLAAETP